MNAQKLLDTATKDGYVYICDSFYLASAENMMADQKDWDEGDQAADIDFTAAPFWIVGTPEPDMVEIYDAKDLEDYLAEYM
ncbi:hypothetical protein [Stutzerimonas kunmingensis]|uniref:Uncharacterized protein n=1 Tax=Stutzerimonas kunmingensis TaxID=1211807 RepID=A0A9X1N456_9GAMM|nr:hypothetical protein [Stutzerimonas kunmingensis]MCD1608608.1 hypothetical protein [Stutzerimonas kunmingensis]